MDLCANSLLNKPGFVSVCDGMKQIEGASATRFLNPLLGKTELSIMSCRNHVSSSDFLPLTIEMSQEMNLKVFSMILQRSVIHL